jgi:DNA-binding NarL/FixJ family response regulator
LRCLTARQQAVFVLIAKGFRNREIAGHLGLSERTIKGYVSALLLVFEATNRTELVGLLSGGGGDLGFSSVRAVDRREKGRYGRTVR